MLDVHSVIVLIIKINFEEKKNQLNTYRDQNHVVRQHCIETLDFLLRNREWEIPSHFDSFSYTSEYIDLFI